MLNIINPDLSENCRIICISDIHTHWRELHQPAPEGMGMYRNISTGDRVPHHIV